MLKGNKYKITALLIVMAMLATCVLTGCGEKKTMSMGGDVSAFVDNIDMDYAYDVTSDLAYNKDLFSNEHGFRNAGSEAEQKTADYLMEMMEDFRSRRSREDTFHCGQMAVQRSDAGNEWSRQDGAGLICIVRN